MLRFMFAGLITVAGVVLLFVASFGDPNTALRDLGNMLPVIPTRPTPTPVAPKVSQMTKPTPVGPEAAAPVAPQAAQPTPPGPDAAALQRERDELQRQVQGLQAKAAQPTPPGPDATALQRERDELQRQVQGLQAKVAQETQDMSALRGQADSARRALDALRQQQAANQAQSDQARQAAQREIEASQQRAADAVKQVAAQQAALDKLKIEAELAKARAGSPGAPQQDVKPAPTARAEPPQAAPKIAARAAPSSSRPAPPDPDSPEAVVNKLRRQAEPYSQVALDAANARPVVPAEQRSAPSRQRLRDARAALAAGRIDEARSVLEQAQVQLVLRPVGPDENGPNTGSVAAGQVAEALSMLGAGDVPRAMRYIELAMAQMITSHAELPAVTAEPSRDRANPPPDYGYAYAPGDWSNRRTSAQ
jgi:hypothetical protein